jgi:phage shock protein C
MTCSNCHKELAGGSNFCSNCGTRQVDTAAAGYIAPAAPAKRLMRLTVDKKIAGVCGGLAEYFEIDPTLVRVLWLLLVFFGGTGVLAYLILWIVLPVAPARIAATSVTVGT